MSDQIQDFSDKIETKEATEPITSPRALIAAAAEQHTTTAKLTATNDPPATDKPAKGKTGPKSKAEKEKEAAEKAAAEAPLYALIIESNDATKDFSGTYVTADKLRAADAKATLSEGKIRLYRLVEVVINVNIDGREI